MNKEELIELELHLEALKLHQEKTLPDDVKEKLLYEIEWIEKKLGKK